MSSQDIRLRGSAKRRYEEYPLGEIPNSTIVQIAKHFVHRITIGHSDITGDDFGNIFADAIDGLHRDSPLGVADVIKNDSAWSVKTVKHKSPFSCKKVRLISGRNSPDYSMGISDARKDPEKTGSAVLNIWNARVNEALQEFDDLRIIVCIRNFATRNFLVFEEEATRFSSTEYEWKFNQNRNLIGVNKSSGEHTFTWQPHGSQFTIIRGVPANSRKFYINQSVPLIEMRHALNLAKFKESWITFEN